MNTLYYKQIDYDSLYRHSFSPEDLVSIISELKSLSVKMYYNHFRKIDFVLESLHNTSGEIIAICTNYFITYFWTLTLIFCYNHNTRNFKIIFLYLLNNYFEKKVSGLYYSLVHNGWMIMG